MCNVNLFFKLLLPCRGLLCVAGDCTHHCASSRLPSSLLLYVTVVSTVGLIFLALLTSLRWPSPLAGSWPLLPSMRYPNAAGLDLPVSCWVLPPKVMPLLALALPAVLWSFLQTCVIAFLWLQWLVVTVMSSNNNAFCCYMASVAASASTRFASSQATWLFVCTCKS